MGKILKTVLWFLLVLNTLVVLSAASFWGYLHWLSQSPERVEQSRQEFLKHPEKSLFYKFIMGSTERDPSCFARDVVLVKIGETVLAVPRKYRPVFHAPKGQKLPYAPGTGMMALCQRKGEPPIEIQMISFSDRPLHIYFTQLSADAVTINPKSSKGFWYDGYYIRYLHENMSEGDLYLREFFIKEELKRMKRRAGSPLNYK